MKAFHFFLPLCLLLFMLTACDSSAPSGQAKFCVADLNKLMRDSLPGKEGAKLIENLQVDLQKELDEIQAKLEKNPQDAVALQQLQETYGAAQQRLQTEGQNIANEIMRLIDGQLNRYRADNGYDMIIASDALYSYNQALDKTNEILALLDKQKLELPTATPQTPASAETQKEAAPATPETAPATKTDEKK